MRNRPVNSSSAKLWFRINSRSRSFSFRETLSSGRIRFRSFGGVPELVNQRLSRIESGERSAVVSSGGETDATAVFRIERNFFCSRWFTPVSENASGSKGPRDCRRCWCSSCPASATPLERFCVGCLDPAEYLLAPNLSAAPHFSHRQSSLCVAVQLGRPTLLSSIGRFQRSLGDVVTSYVQ